MKFIDKLYRLMYGRYGFDDLYYFYLYLYFILLFTNFIIRSIALSIITIIIFVITFYRVFSRNIKRRKKENEIYLNVRNFLCKPFRNIKRNWQDRKTYVYTKCRNCKTTLRIPLPMERGIKTATCPKCKKKRKVLCLRKQKVEIIKAKGMKG